jgi:prepilin-type N-terminal cleavage/methylation domain-containing protein
MLSLRLPRRDERGFTLIEVLISTVILAVIIVPLANALIGFFRSTADTTGKLSESHDLQIATAYFAQDVESLGVHDWSTASFALKQSVEVNVAATGGNYPCGTAGTAAVRLVWDEPTGASQNPDVSIASYVVQPTSTESQLHRVVCRKSGASTVVLSDTVLGHNIGTATASCSTTCTAAPGIPQSVSLDLTIKNPATTAGISVTLVGQRRQS